MKWKLQRTLRLGVATFPTYCGIIITLIHSRKTFLVSLHWHCSSFPSEAHTMQVKNLYLHLFSSYKVWFGQKLNKMLLAWSPFRVTNALCWKLWQNTVLECKQRLSPVTAGSQFSSFSCSHHSGKIYGIGTAVLELLGRTRNIMSGIRLWFRKRLVALMSPVVATFE